MAIKSMTGVVSGRRQTGVSLIELMIAMVLGLLVVAGASAVFLSNKRTYGTSETLNRVQENSRTSFEMMSRDLREAGGNPCSVRSRRVNQLSEATDTNDWWNSSDDGIRGYGGGENPPGTSKGSAPGTRVNRTNDNDVVDIHLAAGGDIRVIRHDNSGAVMDVSSTNGISDGDVVMICNSDYQMVFQVTALPSGLKIQHQGGSGNNCSSTLQIFEDVADCNNGSSGGGASGSGSSVQYCFTGEVGPQCNEVGSSPAFVARVFAARWYIGNNARGGTSLYRTEVMSNGGGVPTAAAPVEIAEGATRLNIRYLRAGQAAFATAATITAADAWDQVVAVQVAVTFAGTRGALRGQDIQGTDGAALERTITNVVALRNREDLL